MTGRKLSREQVEQRRKGLREECRDYAPTRGGYQCQHYVGEGVCRRDDYFMCVVWAKRHPEEMYQAQQSREEKVSTKRRERPAAANKQPECSAGAPPKSPPKPEPKAQVYDLANYGVSKQDGDRHLLDKPELLTEQAVESLCKLGIEVTVKTAAGMEVTLVPKLTGADRCELTFEHARTLVMVLQVFPGATVEQIMKPNKEVG